MSEAYSRLADEYYDPQRHPTCAAFREGSERLVETLLPADPDPATAVEVGAGASLLAPLLQSRGAPLDGLLVTDDSAAMLEHSRPWQGSGARLAVAAASELPVADASASLLVASLADPYDDGAFWAEVRRVLGPGGIAIVTTPSWDWASRFRSNGSPPDTARFLLGTGEVLDLPSYVRPVADEQALIRCHGLEPADTRSIGLAQLERRAPKLDVLSPGDPVVTAYLVRA